MCAMDGLIKNDKIIDACISKILDAFSMEGLIKNDKMTDSVMKDNQ
jgi:hypothetical protein